MLNVREGRSHKFSNAKRKGMTEKSLDCLSNTVQSEKPFSKATLTPVWAALENKEEGKLS